MARLQRLVRADLNKNSDLTPSQRLDASRQFGQIHVDPACVGALYRYLEQGEPQALEDFAVRLSELLDAEGAEAAMRAVEARIPELVRGDDLVSFESRVTRGVIRKTADSQAESISGLHAKVDRLLERERPRVLLLDWVPERRRSELAELAQSHPELVGRLDEVMDPVEEKLRPAEAKKLIEDRPSWLREPPPLLLAVVTRFMETGGFWNQAADAWEEVASLYGKLNDIEREHEALLNAAVSAQLSGEEQRRHELLDLVRSERPDHPR